MTHEFMDNTPLIQTPTALVNQPLSEMDGHNRVRSWIIRLVFGLAIATLFLMAIGSATRVMNAGLSCPDWPLCYGEVIPRDQMNLQVFLEWFHRLIASSMGLATITLLGITVGFRQTLPRWTPWSAVFALFLVIFQGILGGLTVTELLRFDIVTAHLATGLLFFVTLLTIGSLLVRTPQTQPVGRIKWVGLSAAIFVYLQSILGGLVSSQWALHQCLGTAKLCGVMNSHIAGIAPPTIAILCLVVLAWRSTQLRGTLRQLAYGAGLLLLTQITLGVATFRLHLQVEPLTIAHQATGALLLGTLVMFSVLALHTPSPSSDANLNATSLL